MLDVKPWMLPALVAAIAVPIVAGFVIGGPVLGLAAGFLVAAALVVFASRKPPRGQIETAEAPDRRRHVLAVVTHELDDASAIERLKREAALDESNGGVDLLVLAPAQSRLLDRWATDVRRSREEAQRKLVVSVASLGKADIRAEAAVGDQDIVQAVEDQLRSFPATEVILVTGTAEADPEGERAAADLEERLRQPLVRIVLDGFPT